MTEFDLFMALRPMYPAKEYALLPQTANGTGFSAKRHCDALALGLWPSRGMHLSGFEIKCYRGDWIRELRNPEKAEEIARFCNYWWIVASGPFVELTELPEGWGLMTWDEKKSALVKTKAAPFREASHPDFPFVAAMLRKAQDVVGPEAALVEARRQGEQAGRKECAGTFQLINDRYIALQKEVAAFEKESGLKLHGGWHHGAVTGQAVNQILNGTVTRDKDQLIRVAEHILKELSS